MKQVNIVLIQLIVFFSEIKVTISDDFLRKNQEIIDNITLVFLMTNK
jgi:hypothetical protein